MTTSPQVSPRVAAMIKKTRANRGRLIVAMDATASREVMWDVASKLMGDMFMEVAAIGGLDVQLVYYGGAYGEVKQIAWTNDVSELVDRMGTIRCSAGPTNIKGILRHIRAENDREKVNAAVFVGDAIEESPPELYDAAMGLDVPAFWFQEGDGQVTDPNNPYTQRGQRVEDVMRELSKITSGAFAKFDASAAKKLGELLRAVAAFAVGGVAALARQKTESARLLIGQMK